MSLIKFNHSGYLYDDIVFKVDNEHLFEVLYHYVVFLSESGDDIKKYIEEENE